MSVSGENNLKRVCVTRRENGYYYYPKTIPRLRQSLVVTFCLIILTIIAVDVLMGKVDIAGALSSYAFIYLFYFVIILSYRTILGFNERKHLTSRYAGKLKDLLKAAYSFPVPFIAVTVVVALYAMYAFSSHGFAFDQNYNLYSVLPVLFLSHKVLDMDSSPISDSMWIEKCNGLDHGSGMAYSFFYGYLYYILNKTGELGKNLEELMQDYESANKVQFSVYKIFILIPKSLNCPVSLIDVSTIMEEKKSLEPKHQTVAGVNKRVYKNSVYGIKHEKSGKIVYVCAEYATPLQTASLVFKNHTPHTEYYKRHKNDILLQFYLTVKEILETTRFDSMCELVYFEDMDSDGKPYDVGKILLNRIVELKKEARGKV
ncbi:stimulator of interferon genes protein-like [Cylas formicarius]|uniref:stimulator of interferon genes protein-like n=1 Tax=Cylas formicarius TaxID=197179 RepID=UPI0029583B24|nr:stimulator of interferon genes protein-like [Cylas formicarius]